MGDERRGGGDRGRAGSTAGALVTLVVLLVAVLALRWLTTPSPTPTPPPSPPPSASSAPPAPTLPPGGPREVLAALTIDDSPAPNTYRRDEWPHWLDLDGDGCDAREQALRAASTVAAQVGAGCRITAGHWVSAYDGVETSDPSTFDVDHVVPLAEANRSGGWAWSTDQRARYANDPAVLWVVSAAANRSKGDKDPSQWRPSNQAVWCEYATRWVSIKATYRLTADTAERDALGQMLERCPTAP